MLDERDHPKISDFGLSSVKRIATQSLRSSGVGSLLWMAPELFFDAALADAGAPTQASDVYALGVLLWECLARALPYADVASIRNPAAQLPSLVLNGRRPTLELLPEDTPAAVRALIEACWVAEPAARPTAAAVAAALEAEVAKASEISQNINIVI